MKSRILTCLALAVALTGCVPLPPPTPAAISEAQMVAPATATPKPSPTPRATAAPATATEDELEQSISRLRHLDPAVLDTEQSEEMPRALSAIASAGPDGANRLKQELAAIEQSGEPDAPFQILASALLWELGKLDEAETIAAIWSSIPPDEWNYRLLFLIALNAASTQDSRALPILKVLLSDKEGAVFQALAYPLTHEYVWGAYGSKGLPVLHEVLQASEDPVAVESAINLLARAQYLPALPDIRAAVNSQEDGVRRAAIFALGVFGHPDDFDLLMAGLNSKDSDDLFQYVYGLVEYGDLRATLRLIPLLQNGDAAIRGEVAWGFGNYLAAPDSLAALHECAEATEDAELAEDCAHYLAGVLAKSGLTWEEYASRSPDEQAQIAAAARDSSWTLQEGEEALTQEQFLSVLAEWPATSRMTDGGFESVEMRQLLPVATSEDLDALLNWKARFYLRLSDEAIYDVRDVDALVKWLGRSRYRAMALPTPSPTPPPTPSTG